MGAHRKYCIPLRTKCWRSLICSGIGMSYCQEERSLSVSLVRTDTVLIAFRCHQDCYPFTCDKTVSAVFQLFALIPSWERQQEDSTLRCPTESSRLCRRECRMRCSLCVCVREHLRSEVKPRRPTSCTESTHGSWGTCSL